MIRVLFDNKLFSTIDHPSELETLQLMNIEGQLTLHPEDLAAYNKKIALQETRNAIQEEAGDTESLLGTLSDITQLQLMMLSQLVVGIRSAKSFASLRAVVEPHLAAAEQFLESVESKNTRLPFLEKGEKSVLEDFKNQSTTIAAVLEKNKIQ